MSFRRLKVGDRIMRSLAGMPMPMQVTAVDDKVVTCAAVNKDGSLFYGGWQFDRDLGCEEDHELGWGREFGVSGSHLQKQETMQ